MHGLFYRLADVQRLHPLDLHMDARKSNHVRASGQAHVLDAPAAPGPENLIQSGGRLQLANLALPLRSHSHVATRRLELRT
jgi:hypothetical protein